MIFIPKILNAVILQVNFMMENAFMNYCVDVDFYALHASIPIHVHV